MTDVSFALARNSAERDAAQLNKDIPFLTNRSAPTPSPGLFHEDYSVESGYAAGYYNDTGITHGFHEDYSVESGYARELERNVDAESGLSMRRSTGFVGVNETWDDYTNVDARIVEVGEDWVRLDCLVDSENQVFQERTFQRRLLEGALPVRTGAYVLIRIFTSPGKIKHTFTDGEKYVRKEFFEDDSWFVDLEDAGLDEMLR